MWGTSSPGDKLTGDFDNEPDATSICDRGFVSSVDGKFVTCRFSDCCNKTLPTAVIGQWSLNHLVRERQKIIRNFDAERLSGLDVDHEFELRRLHHR
jgi:hypothetical protein